MIVERVVFAVVACLSLGIAAWLVVRLWERP